MRTARIVIFAIAGALIAFALYTLLTPPPAGTLPSWNRPVAGYEIINLFLAVVSLAVAGALVRAGLHKTRERLARGVKRLVAVCVSISALLVIFDVVLASRPEMQKGFVNPLLLWPQGQPFYVEDKRYGFRGKPGFEKTIQMDPMKDLPAPFYDPSKIVESGEKRFTSRMIIDANGFPNPSVPPSADVVLLGDSFATPWYVDEGKDWVSLVRERWKKSFYSLAMPGWGPRREQLAYFDYGINMLPRFVIWAFYEGNDVPDAGDFYNFKRLQSEKGMKWEEYTAMKLGLPPFEFPYDRPLARLLLRLASRLNPPPENPGGKNDLIPFMLTAGGRTRPQSFNQFITLALDENELRKWPDWSLATEAIGEVAEDCRKRNTALVFVYLPHKEHVYLKMVLQQADPALLYRFGNAPTPGGKTLDQDEFIRRLETNSESMCKLVKEFCEARQIIFIDATGDLKDAAERGEFPYYCYDTHLNETGNAIVAEAVLRRLSALPADRH